MLYHVFIEHLALGVLNHTLSFNLSEKELKTLVTEPFMAKRPFSFGGFMINPDNVKRISIFGSEEFYENIILPDGKKAIDESPQKVCDLFGAKKVMGVHYFNLIFLYPSTNNELIKNNTTRGKSKIFIVHGRDKAPALELKDYLKDTYSLDVVIFDDVKRKKTSPTIIGLLEDIMSNAGYAFVVATPDDLGSFNNDLRECKEELLMNTQITKQKSIQTLVAILNKRARQNVVFEHGLFIGALGKERVCCLIQKDVKEKPTDIDGILYVPFNESIKETFPEIVEKLKDPKIGLIKP